MQKSNRTSKVRYFVFFPGGGGMQLIERKGVMQGKLIAVVYTLRTY